MKIVQSFFTNTQALKALNGGYYNTRYHLMGWALSARLLKKNHERVELLTDSFGKQLLVDELGLPYTSVNMVYDDYKIDQQYENFWLLKKMYGHTQQNEPFIFIDGDAFMFQPFKQSFSDSPLIAQNLNRKSIRFYSDCVKSIIKNFDYIPDYLRIPYEQNGHVFGCCTGITGGANTEFYKLFHREVLHFLDRNKKNINRSNSFVYTPAFNIMLEEAFFFNLARECGIPISYLIEQPLSSYSDFMNFHQCPQSRSFLHLMFKMKSLLFVGDMVEKRLMAEFPEVYDRLRSFADRHSLDQKSKGGVRHEYSKFSRYKKEKPIINNVVASGPREEINSTSTMNALSKTVADTKTSVLDLYQYELAIDQKIQGLSKKQIAQYDTFRAWQITSCQRAFRKEEGSAWIATISPYARLLTTDIPASLVQLNYFNFNLELRKKREHCLESFDVHHVLVYLNPSTGEVTEFRLLSEKMLFEWLAREPLSVEEIIDKIEHFCQTTLKLYLRDVLIDWFRFFIYIGAISLTKEDSEH